MDSSERLLALHLSILLRQLRREEKDAMDAALKETGLTLGQYDLLSTVFVLGPMTVKDFLEKTGATSGNATVILRNLERDRLIQKKVRKDDKRSYEIRLSKKGVALMEKIYPSVNRRILEDSFSPLSREEKETLIDLLKKVKKGKEL